MKTRDPYDDPTIQRYERALMNAGCTKAQARHVLAYGTEGETLPEVDELAAIKDLLEKHANVYR